MSENHSNQNAESQENSKPGYFAIIPAHVRYCKNIEMGAKLLYGEITCLANAKGYCWASNRYFAELYEVNESTIKRWISSLQSQGYIEIDTQKKGVLWDRKIWISPEIKKISTKAQKCTFEGSKTSLRRVENEPIIEQVRILKEEYKEREGASPPPPPSQEEIFSFGRVKILNHLREKLIQDFGASKVQEYVEKLNEFADINPKRFRAYANHATVVRKWIREDIERKKTQYAQKPSKHTGISAKSYDEKIDYDFSSGGQS